MKSNKKIGICADHGGFELKEKLIPFLIKKPASEFVVHSGRLDDILLL